MIVYCRLVVYSSEHHQRAQGNRTEYGGSQWNGHAIPASFFFVAANCAGLPYAKKKFGNKFSAKTYDLEKNTPGKPARSRTTGVFTNASFYQCVYLLY